MDWSNSFVYITMISGLIFLAAGIVLYKFPPKNINYFYGYRTRSSMKSQDRWYFAQIYSSKELVRWSLVMIAVGLTGTMFEIGEAKGEVAGITIVLLLSAVLIIRTEKALKRKFGTS